MSQRKCLYCGERPHQRVFCPYSAYNRQMEAAKRREEKQIAKEIRERKKAQVSP